MRFRWNKWNIEHIAGHGVGMHEAEVVIAESKSPFPLWRPDDRWLVWGPGVGGRLLQVVFVLDEDGTVYVVHARSLTTREKARLRRRSKP